MLHFLLFLIDKIEPERVVQHLFIDVLIKFKPISFMDHLGCVQLSKTLTVTRKQKQTFC